MKSSLISFSIFIWSLLYSCDAYDYVITLFRRNGSSYIVHKRCPAAGSLFAPALLDDDLIGCHTLTDPADGCSELGPPGQSNETRRFTCFVFIALIERGNCTYAKKTYNAQEAGYQGVVVYDNEFNTNLSPMSGDGVYDSEIGIPAFMISKTCGLFIENFSFENGNMLMVSRVALDFGKYMIPFIIVVGICLFIAVIALGVKFIRDKRHEFRRRLSRRNLKKIPTKKYKKNDIPETCPICLEDFDDGDRLRILPCSHWYHIKCVDPWLTKNRKICPVCKRKVVKGDSDSSSDDHYAPIGAAAVDRPATSRTEEERTPLLTPDSPPTNRYGSVYSSSLEDETPVVSTSHYLMDSDSGHGFMSRVHSIPSDVNQGNITSHDSSSFKSTSSLVTSITEGCENEAFENEDGTLLESTSQANPEAKSLL